MKNLIPEDLLTRIEETPEHVLMSSGSGSEKYAKLALTLNNIEAGKSIVYSIQEFKKMFGASSSFKSYMKKCLKKLGVKDPGIYYDNEKVYVFNRRKV